MAPLRLTAQERAALPAEVFLDPARRLFPVRDQEDVQHWAALLDRAGDPDKLRPALIDFAKKRGLQPPDTPPAPAASFSLEGAEAKGDTVIRTAPVFWRADSYEFQNAPPYEMTPEDNLLAVRTFAPVPLADTHGSSVFNGKLGHVVELVPSADFNELGLKAEIPQWLHQLFKDEPLKVSATWDRGRKQLSNVALVPNPRITDAALFAAFAKEEVKEEMAKEKKRMATPHGRAAMQRVHDTAAMSGALCGKTAEFTTRDEHEGLQRIHDEACKGGAECSLYDPEKAKAMFAAGQSAPPVEPSQREKQLEAELKAERQKAVEEARKRRGAEAEQRAAEFTARHARLTPAARNALAPLAQRLAAFEAEATFAAEGQANGHAPAGGTLAQLERLLAELGGPDATLLTQEHVAATAPFAVLDHDGRPAGSPGKAGDERRKAREEADRALASTPTGLEILERRKAAAAERKGK